MFKVHHNTCRPFTQDGHHTRRDIFNWACGLTSPLHRWWLILVVLLLSMLSQRWAHLPVYPCYPSIPLSPILGTKSVKQ